MADATNNYNARDFLRDSIAGDVNAGFSPPISASPFDNDSEITLPLLPILVPQSETNLSEFIVQEEKKLHLDFYQSFQNLPPEQQAAANDEHSLKLFSFALSHLQDDSLELSSNALSLVVLLSSNYFYNYFFALVRYNLEDYAGAFSLISTAYSQIANKQTLPTQLSDLVKQTNFAAHFYTLYLILASQNNQPVQVKDTLFFILEKHLIQDPNLLLVLILQLGEDQKAVSLLTKEAVSFIGQILDPATKNQFINNLKTIFAALNEDNQGN